MAQEMKDKVAEQRKVNNGDAMNKKKHADCVAKGRTINAKLAAKMLREKQ